MCHNFEIIDIFEETSVSVYKCESMDIMKNSSQLLIVGDNYRQSSVSILVKL